MSTTKYPILARLISSAEGNINSVNRGVAGDTPGGGRVIFGKDLTDTTLSEIINAQAVKRVFAVGRYQFIPSTLKSAINYTKVPLTAKFDLATQNILFDYLIDAKRKKVGQYIRGESNNKNEAIQELAREFASIGLAYSEAGRVRGQSRYSGTGGNKASISPERVAIVLDEQRKEILGSILINNPSDLENFALGSCNCGVNTGNRYEFSVVYKKTEQATNPNTKQIRRDWLYLQIAGNLEIDKIKTDKILIYLK